MYEENTGFMGGDSLCSRRLFGVESLCSRSFYGALYQEKADFYGAVYQEKVGLCGAIFQENAESPSFLNDESQLKDTGIHASNVQKMLKEDHSST